MGPSRTPKSQAQQHHSWAPRNTFVIVIVTAIVTAVVIVMLSVTCIKPANTFKGFSSGLRDRALVYPFAFLFSVQVDQVLPCPPIPAHTLHTLVRL